MTNRELYKAVVGLAERHRNSTRTLQEYLGAMWQLASTKRHQPSLGDAEFMSLLGESFTANCAAFDNSWLDSQARGECSMHGFDAWAARITRQIAELRLMGENGTLASDMRYFGVSGPLGGYWCNFEPLGFLECATVGTFGGWLPGDAGGRELVPGEVAVMTADGRLESRAPQERKKNAPLASGV